MVTPTPTFVIGTMIPIDYTDESKETQTATAPWGLIAAGVVLIGGAGGVYAYAMNQNRKRKAAAARAAQARRAQAAQNPNARRPQGAPQQPAAGQGGSPYTVKQPVNPYAQSSTGSPYAGSETRNPYSNGSIIGSGEGAATGGFAPVSSAQPEGSYAPPAARPEAAQESQQPAAMGSNPFARPIGQTAENPYARPAGSDAAEQPAPRRRSGRMERYHDAGNGTDAEA